MQSLNLIFNTCIFGESQVQVHQDFIKPSIVLLRSLGYGKFSTSMKQKTITHPRETLCRFCRSSISLSKMPTAAIVLSPQQAACTKMMLMPSLIQPLHIWFDNLHVKHLNVCKVTFQQQ